MQVFTKEVDVSKHVLEWGEFRDGYDTRDIKTEGWKQFLNGMNFAREKVESGFDYYVEQCHDMPKPFKKMAKALAQDIFDTVDYMLVLDMGMAAIEALEDEYDPSQEEPTAE